MCFFDYSNFFHLECTKHSWKIKREPEPLLWRLMDAEYKIHLSVTPEEFLNYQSTQVFLAFLIPRICIIKKIVYHLLQQKLFINISNFFKLRLLKLSFLDLYCAAGCGVFFSTAGTSFIYHGEYDTIHQPPSMLYYAKILNSSCTVIASRIPRLTEKKNLITTPSCSFL